MISKILNIPVLKIPLYFKLLPVTTSPAIIAYCVFFPSIRFLIFLTLPIFLKKNRFSLSLPFTLGIKYSAPVAITNLSYLSIKILFVYKFLIVTSVACELISNTSCPVKILILYFNYYKEELIYFSQTITKATFNLIA